MAWQTEYSKVIDLVSSSALVSSISVFAYNVQFPATPIFPSSLLPNIGSYSIWLHIVLAIPTGLFLLAGWAAEIVVCLIFYFPVYTVIFILTEMR